MVKQEDAQDAGWDWDDPLARMAKPAGKRESLRAWQALLDYEAMGQDRSFRKLLDGYLGKYEPGHEFHDRFAQYRGEVAGGTVVKPPTRRYSSLEEWSSPGMFCWQDRIARAMDIQRNARLAIRAAREAELEDRDWTDGAALRKVVAEFLAELPKHKQVQVKTTEGEDGSQTTEVILALNTTVDQLARALKASSDLQRASVGAANGKQVHELQGAGGGPVQVLGIEIIKPGPEPEDEDEGE